MILELNKHKTDSILSMVSENLEVNLVGHGIWHGKEESSKFLSNLFQGFADLFITPITILLMIAPIILLSLRSK
ncbi:hypothetical protein NARC_50196 [Candidatus Nitrosocosmicus arcticus]|uniref:Uncharacterized protein n=1 Tax=Candidatus Nitrosocosmicus arcticus TaxID=2035267 RepID=A0A557SWN6_9ARCH|nr:hypothetical protein NARC_50196 [Candidatus Nitrosocosmicus arcticus]